MKFSLRTVFGIILLLALVAAGCSEDSTSPNGDGDGNNNNNNNPSAGSISCDINGTNWTSNIAASDTAGFNGVVTALGLAGTQLSDNSTFAIGLADLAGISERTYNQGGGGVITITGNLCSIRWNPICNHCRSGCFSNGNHYRAKLC